MAISDDFASGVLDSVWSIEGPSGISSGLGANATDAYLELVSPDGDYDVWNTNNGTRAMQATNNGDFQIETRFLTTPTEKYQIQGLLVEQDADNWLRFDTYSNGRKLYAFAAITIDGVSTQAFRVTVSGGTAPYLRVDRTGDTWTMEYSQDGSNWTTAGSFNHAMTVSQAGVFTGNTGNALGFTAQVDYFENTADPIVNEDGTITPSNDPPDAVDDGLATDEDVALVINVAGDLLANDSDPEGDPISLTGVTQPANGVLTDNGNGTYTYTPNAGFSGADSFTYTISDGNSTDTATVNLTVNDTTPSNDPPDAVDDGLATDEDVALVINVAGDLLANDSDPEGDPISLTGVTQPANGVLTDNGNGTYTYTPNAGFSGADSFTYTISDGNSTDTATVNLTVNGSAPAPAGLASDDFASGVLDSVWSIEGPSGISSGLGANATDAYLELVSPDGDYDVWNTNNGTRAMQATNNGDFQIETRFLTTPTEKYQIQGLLVEQDADNWLRFDTYSNGRKLYAFAAITIDGVSTQAFRVTVSGGTAPYLRVDRTGDTWTMEYSQDGSNWTTAG
ncbi:cadherin-like domain-containing protein, partial [Ruegeria atlantica]|uniref:cadherin-like domain-containing protein n=1 Tax=Ruegeria atlantica TaxID=81569 RepID=UPI00130DB1F0